MIDVKAIISFIVVICFMVLVGIFMYHPVPVANEKYIYAVSMLLIGIVTTIINFYFGSSEGSKRKTELLNAATDTTKNESPNDEQAS